MSVPLIVIRRLFLLPLTAVVAGLILVVSQVAASPFGIAVHLPNQIQLDHTAALGVDWIRIDFIWALAEPEQDVFEWERFDQLIADAEERNLRIFATIAGTPAWATSGIEGPGVPDHPADWTDFCYRAAARYRGRVEAWGMWNEPNLDRFWDGTRQDYFARVLLRGAKAVHAADGQALVGGPELAHLNSADWEDWLRTCVGGAQAELDVVTHHVYPSGVWASDVTRKLNDGGSYPWEPPSVREVLQDVGWWGRPFWLTESGVETDQGGPWAQAVFYEDLMQYWFPPDGSAKWIDRLFFYQLVDDPRFPDITFGVIGPPPELERKLAFEYYEDAIAAAVVDDARVLSWKTTGVVTPGQWNQATVQVINEGTTTWRADDGFGVSVEGLPENWEIMVDQAFQDENVPPGWVAEISLQLMPPMVGWDFPNLRHTIIVRMTGRDGLGLGSPHRTSVVSGWRSLPEIVRQPLTVVVDEGEEAQFRVVADGGGDLEFFWIHNGTEAREGNRFSGTDTPVLTVHDSDAADTGDYQCKVTSSAGWVLSNYAQLVLADGARGGPRESGGRSPDGWGPLPSFESFFRDAARRHGQLTPKAETPEPSSVQNPAPSPYFH